MDDNRLIHNDYNARRVMWEKGVKMNRSDTAKRTYYKDAYNEMKVWEVVELKGGYYLRQYINGKQFGRGIRITKAYLHNTGILEFDCIGQSSSCPRPTAPGERRNL